MNLIKCDYNFCIVHNLYVMEMQNKINRELDFRKITQDERKSRAETTHMDWPLYSILHDVQFNDASANDYILLPAFGVLLPKKYFILDGEFDLKTFYGGFYKNPAYLVVNPVDGQFHVTTMIEFNRCKQFPCVLFLN